MYKILVVDDSPIELLGMRDALLRANFQVVTCHIKQFSEVFKLSEVVVTEQPDLILMDVNLGLSAYDGTRLAKAVIKLREPGEPKPYVALHSSLGGDELQRLREECGADAFLEKGNLQQLPARIKTLLLRL